MARYAVAALLAFAVLAITWLGPGTRQPAEDAASTGFGAIAPEGTPLEPGEEADCFLAPAEDDLVLHSAQVEQQQEQLLRVLSVSSDAEHLMVAALASWRRPNNTALLLLKEASDRDPRNPLVAAQTLELCLQIDACRLPGPQLERKLIAADGDNTMAWILIARSRLQRGDEASALAAVRYAFAAATVDDYFVDYVLAFDRGFAAASDFPPYERGVAAIGHASAMVSGALSITEDCRERAENLPEWRDACLRLGERLGVEGTTMLLRSIGFSLQEQMYEYEGDSRAMQAAASMRARDSEAYSTLASRMARVRELRDATVLRRYLETYQASGEIAAMQYLAGQLEARLPASNGAAPDACGAP